MGHGHEAGAGCAARVWDGRWHQPCRNKPKLEEDGKRWCRIHAPSIVAERRQARDAKWDAKWKAKDKRRAEAKARQAEVERRAECYPALLEVSRETLVAFENVMPKHLYKHGCFNWESQPDDCPCLAHKIRAAIKAAS